MVPENVLTADKDTIVAFLAQITSGWDELPEPAVLELRCLFPGRNPDICRFEPIDEGFAALADHAAVMNTHGRNIYIVVNPVRVTAPLRRDGKLSGAFDSDIIAARYFWADGDDEEAANSIRNFAGPRWTMAVTTGRIPAARPHIYWRAEDWIFNLPAWTGVQKAIAARLSTDRTVVNPSRIMRLPGTINWPTEQKAAKGRVPELTTLRTEYDDDRDPVSFDQMLRAFGSVAEGAAEGAAAAAASAPGAIQIDTGGENRADKLISYLAMCSIDGQKHQGVRGVTSMLAARGNSPDILEAVVRFACPVWDSNVERLIQSAYRFAPDDPPGDGPVEVVEPVDLWGRFTPPALPRGMLPRVIEDFAFQKAEQMGADAGGLAAAALCVACAAVPDQVKLKVKKHEQWTESARIWVALVGDPSTKKSPVLGAAERPLRRVDAEMFKTYIDQKRAYDALKKDEKAEAERPKHRRKRLEDTTIEAAQDVLADSPEGVLVLQDELSGWFGGMDRYNGGKGGKDRSFWLQAFNGGSYAVNRVGRGASMIPNLSVSVLGGIQPEPIRRVVADAADDGLIQRLFPVLLRPATLGSEEAPETDATRDYDAAIRDLCAARLAQTSFIDMGEPVTLIFDVGAQALRRQMEARHLELMHVECINRKLAAHIGKYDGLFARLCVIFHCLDHWRSAANLPTVIDISTATRAAAFLHGFLLKHAFAFYGGVLDLSDDHDRLTAVAGFILARNLDTLTVRDVQRGDNTMRGLTKPDVMRVFEQLEALGWVRIMPSTRANGSPACAVNPEVHKRFSDRRAGEAKRRAAAMATIKEELAGE